MTIKYMDSLLQNSNSVLSKQLKYNFSGPPNRLPTRPLSPRMRVRTGVLKKALILGFEWIGTNLSGGGVHIREILIVEKFIRSIAPFCEIRVMNDRPFNKHDPRTSNGVSIAAVLANMEWLASDLRPGENVFFYYTGHSTTRLDTEEFPLHPYYYSDKSKYYSGIPAENEPEWDLNNPPNPLVNDEPMIPNSSANSLVRGRDVCLAIPEMYWHFTHYVDDGVGGSIPVRGQWDPKPATIVLVRDDKIRQLIVDKIPTGSKCLLYLGGCYSRGGGDVPYDWDLMERDTNGNIVQIDKNRIGEVDKCAIGMNYDLTHATHSTTNGQVVVITSSQYDEEAGSWGHADMSDFANNFWNAWKEQIEENISRNRSSKTIINLKRFYHYIRLEMTIEMTKTSPQISTGTNMGIPSINNKGTTFVEASNEGIIPFGDFTISSPDGGDTIYVNGQLINGNKTINNTLVYIENGKTLVIGDYDFDIIKPVEEGQPFILDIPVMFDIGSRLFDTTQ